MSYYLTYIGVSIATIILLTIPLGLLIRGRREKLSRISLSTADFLPIIGCVSLAIVLGELIEVILLEQIIKDESSAVIDGISNSLMTGFAIWGFCLYKSQQL